MRDYAGSKRIALLACLLHSARARARNDLAEMFCKRVAAMTTNAKAQLGAIREQQRAITETTDLKLPRHPRAARPRQRGAGDVLATARHAINAAGGFADELADIEAVSAHHGDNYQLLVERFYRRDRAQMLATVNALELQATSSDRSVLDALEHVLAHAHLTRDLDLPPVWWSQVVGVVVAVRNRRLCTDFFARARACAQAREAIGVAGGVVGLILDGGAIPSEPSLFHGDSPRVSEDSVGRAAWV